MDHILGAQCQLLFPSDQIIPYFRLTNIDKMNHWGLEAWKDETVCSLEGHWAA